MWNGVDRRKFPRAEYPCLITLRKSAPPVEAILTHTEDISAVGVRVFMRRKLEVMTEVDLELELKDTYPNVISKGVIKWAKEVSSVQEGRPRRYEVGVQFTYLKDEDRRRISDIVKHLVERNR